MRPLNSKCCVSDMCWVEQREKVDVIKITSIAAEPESLVRLSQLFNDHFTGLLSFDRIDIR